MSRRGFAIIELPLVIGILAVLLEVGLIIAGWRTAGCMVAAVGMLPAAWLLVWPLIHAGSKKQQERR